MHPKSDLLPHKKVLKGGVDPEKKTTKHTPGKMCAHFMHNFALLEKDYYYAIIDLMNVCIIIYNHACLKLLPAYKSKTTIVYV